MGDTGRSPAATAGPRVVRHEETMCCGFKKCPTVRVFDDGSLELSDDDSGGDSVGTIRLRPEQARRLAEILRG